MYLPFLALEVYKRLFNDSLGFMAVYEIRNTFGLTQSNILTLALQVLLTLVLPSDHIPPTALGPFDLLSDTNLKDIKPDRTKFYCHVMVQI